MEELVAQYRVHLTEVFIEVFLLAIQNPVDGPRLVVKLFVSVISVRFNRNSYAVRRFKLYCQITSMDKDIYQTWVRQDICISCDRKL